MKQLLVLFLFKGCFPLASAVLVLGTWTPPAARAATITFDDLPRPYGSNNYAATMPDFYSGLGWTNFGYLDATRYSYQGGYWYSIISSNYVIYNGSGQPAQIGGSQPFNLNSAYVTAAWNDDLQFEVQGFRGGTLVYDRTYTLSATTPTFLEFDCLEIDSANFNSFGGTRHPNYGRIGTQFALDNLSVTFVPEPGIPLLLLIGSVIFGRFKPRTI